MWNKFNSEQELIQGIINHGPDILDFCQTNDDLSKYFNRLDQERLNYPRPKNQVDSTKWFIPHDYQHMDIEGFLIDRCPKENYDRLHKEISLYKKHNMIPVLKTVKYIVDILRKNNVVWGVGRGSSVSSYVLYLIGIHKIDSVKYKLPIEEFFKEI
jgi:DNA polymerase III alpha subunit